MLEKQQENEDSKNFKELNIIKRDSYSQPLDKGLNTNKDDDLLGSEEIFISIKKEIETTKKRNEEYHLKKESIKTITNNNANSKKNIDNEIINNNHQTKTLEEKTEKENNLNENDNINYLLEFNLNDDETFFEYTQFNPSANKNEQFNLNKNWINLDKNFSRLYEIHNEIKGYEYIELNQMALRFIKEIDYDEIGLELNLNFNLIGSSQMFIFTRCFVNKDINESSIFDEYSQNIEPNDIFNKYSSLIKITKDNKSDSCFLTFSKYYNDVKENNRLRHKDFLKRQLIDYSDKKKNGKDYYKSDDKTEFNVIINDFGEEIINVRVYLNNNEKPNDISSNFFIPINKKAKIMIFGKGASVRLKDISGKIFNKRNDALKNLIKFETENSTPKNCECCNII